jgi:glycerophosphoryl diester phosphodiesterase
LEASCDTLVSDIDGFEETMSTQPPPFFRQAKFHPEVIAHRGGAGQWPGETLFAFERAGAAGADVLEMDVRATSDGQLVLIHNAAVDETTDGTGSVGSMTLAEVKRLDAGFRWTEDGVSFPFRGKGITVPTLAEVFEAFPHARMNIEIKQESPSVVPQLCELIRQFGAVERVLVASFWGSVLGEFRRACPGVATSASTPESLKFYALNVVLKGNKYRPEAEALQVGSRIKFFPVITSGLVAAAHRQNLPLHAWTVNDPDEMRRMIAVGVDGIITDYPTRLLELLGRVPRV